MEKTGELGTHIAASVANALATSDKDAATLSMEETARVLALPAGKLARLADLHRTQELRKKIDSPPVPLFMEVRELILDKCKRSKRAQVRAIFEKEPFGELERLVTQKLLDVVKALAREELGRENGLRLVGRMSGRSYKQMRVAVLEFLDTDVFRLSPENCVGFMDPLIVSWDIDLVSFGLEIVLNRRIAPAPFRKFEFVERQVKEPLSEEPGLREFLKDRSLSRAVTREEVDFLKKIRFDNGRRPTALYYYRELQNFRDPLHFRPK